MSEPRWSVAEHDGRFSISDRDNQFSFDIVPFQRTVFVKGTNPHLTLNEKRYLATYVANALNMLPDYGDEVLDYPPESL
jgi:hypothetical protein